MDYLNGYDSDENLAGFGSRLKKKLKRLAKSKVFKAALVVGAGVAAYSYAGPLIKAGISKKRSAMFKKAGKKLMSKGRKKLRARAKQAIGIPPATQRNMAAMKQEIRRARTLPPQQREQELLRSRALAQNAYEKSKAVMEPVFRDEYQDQGYSQESAQIMADQDAGIAANETVKNLQDKTTGGGLKKMLLPALAIGSMFMFK